ncbi:WecB/TagA/CpsF family glycosyltransferase [soil metagenome]
MLKKSFVLNSQISIAGRQKFIDEVFTLVEQKVPSYICFANVHMVMEAYNDRAFQKVVNESDIVTPDGKPISIFMNAFDGLNQERLCGMDLFPELLRQAEKEDKSVYFYGGTNDVLTQISQKIQKELPSLRISGSYSPPFRKLSQDEDDAIVVNIKNASPDLVFVSLGCPKQEKWMAEHKSRLGTCLLGVGQAFKTFIGLERRLPSWMRNLSLEWIYRLYLEPRRLWKRYFSTNTYFLWLTVGCIFRLLGTKVQSSFSGLRFAQGQQADE